MRDALAGLGQEPLHCGRRLGGYPCETEAHLTSAKTSMSCATSFRSTRPVPILRSRMGLRCKVAPLTWPTRALIATLAALLGLTFVSATARASDGCGGPLEQPFLTWGDDGNYWLAPGGSFEDGAVGWQLADGAQLVSPQTPAPGPSGQTAL